MGRFSHTWEGSQDQNSYEIRLQTSLVPDRQDFPYIKYQESVSHALLLFSILPSSQVNLRTISQHDFIGSTCDKRNIGAGDKSDGGKGLIMNTELA